MEEHNEVHYIISETPYGYLEALKDLLRSFLNKLFNFNQRN